jgi:diaminohydroxyphosphoribosylaminopyrimidine deaminase / 5-amino-6-(5-phosphoribosylamino)uracil reductase
VHLLRAENDAIMVGIGTALADDPLLTCRLPGMAKRSPVRIIADSKLRLPIQSKLAQSARDTPVWALCSNSAAEQAAASLLSRGVNVLRSSNSADPLDIRGVLGLLSAAGITRLMVEGGPTLAAAFVAADLVDKAVLFHSPMVVGADGIEALASGPMAALSARLKQVSSEAVGPDREDRYVRG